MTSSGSIPPERTNLSKQKAHERYAQISPSPLGNGIFVFEGEGQPIGERLADAIETNIAGASDWIAAGLANIRAELASIISSSSSVCSEPDIHHRSDT